MSFQSRHTLSSDVPASAGKGINAAAEWIKSELEAYSKACGGCLEVKTDEFTQETGKSHPEAHEAHQCVCDPEGHRPGECLAHHPGDRVITTRATPRPTTLPAPRPGANDDGSGTAVSMECARVLSQHKFPATLIFLTVAGEEQGLYGSAHFAKMAKAQGWNIEAVLNNDIVGGDRSPETGPAHGAGVFGGNSRQRHEKPN